MTDRGKVGLYIIKLENKGDLCEWEFVIGISCGIVMVTGWLDRMEVDTGDTGDIYGCQLLLWTLHLDNTTIYNQE